MNPVAARELRRVFGHLPTGVTALTGAAASGPVGMALNSVTSVSLDPPLVLFCPSKTSATWPQLRAAGRFCINVLGEQHEAASRRFAAKGDDRFTGLRLRERPGGPALDDAVAWIDCALYAEHDAGDHTIVVAEILAVDAAADVLPLIFFQGRYGRFERLVRAG